MSREHFGHDYKNKERKKHRKLRNQTCRSTCKTTRQIQNAKIYFQYKIIN